MIKKRLILLLLSGYLTLIFSNAAAQKIDFTLSEVALVGDIELFSIQAATFLDENSILVSDRTLQKLFAFNLDGTELQGIKEPSEIHPGIEFSPTQLHLTNGKILALAMMVTPSLFVYESKALTDGKVLFTKAGTTQGFSISNNKSWVIPFGNSSIDLTLIDAEGSIEATYPVSTDFPNYSLSSDRVRLFSRKGIIYATTPLDYRLQCFDTEKRKWLAPFDYSSYMKMHGLGVPIDKDIVAGPDMNAFMTYYNKVSEHFSTDSLTGNDSLIVLQLTKGGSEYVSLLIDIASDKVVGHIANEYEFGNISANNQVLMFKNDENEGVKLFLGQIPAVR